MSFFINKDKRQLEEEIFQSATKTAREFAISTQISRELKDMAAKLTPGDLSRNMDFIHIQKFGEFISPSGQDRLCEVTLYKVTGEQKVTVATIQTTNALYVEWLTCCCDTMWHTESKVLYDCHGNVYPVGKMDQMHYHVKYDT